jgi:predicted TIM-barrel fold metal-dependent hydrolase
VIRFVDAHVHPPVPAFLNGPVAPYRDQLASFLDRPIIEMDPASLAGFYRERAGMAVLLGWDTESATRLRPLGNEDIAGLVASAPDVFVGMGAVDPRKGARAVAEVHAAARLGLKGISLHPIAQGFDPADRANFPVWETAAGHHLVCLFHTGFTRLGAGSAGGAGLRLGRGRPLGVDVIAAEFPELRILIAHTGALWREEVLHIAAHKANVSICLSGQPPQQLDAEWRDAITSTLATRVVFGSDFPFGSPDRWLDAWAALGLPEDATRRVLRDNAIELLGLDAAP